MVSSSRPRIRLFRRILAFTVPALLLGGYQFYLKQNGGFAMWKIPTLALDPSSLYLPPEEVIEEMTPPLDEVRTTLSQEFKFLGRGGQSFAFLGEDGETVLKIFKNYRYRTYDLLGSFPFPSALREMIQTGLEVRKFKRTRFYRGCVIAAYEIPEVTEVSYIHLFPTKDLKLNLKVKDALGISHELDADAVQFLLQKKLTVADVLAKQLIRDGDQEGFETMLLATEEMMRQRYEHGITDGDFAFDKNVGFLGGKAVLLDFGSIIKKDQSDEKQKTELVYCVREEMNRLRRLLTRRYPDATVWLKEFFDENPKHLEFAHFLETALDDEPSKSAEEIPLGDIAQARSDVSEDEGARSSEQKPL